MSVKPQVGIVGAGKVGTTLARLLFERGYRITSVYNRNITKANELAMLVRAKSVPYITDVVQSTDLILLTVSDDAIQNVAREFVSLDLHGKAVVHTSGVHEAEAIQILLSYGAMIGSLHPIFPFASVESSIKGLPGSTFGIQAEASILRTWLVGLVEALHGQTVLIARGQKILYHSALVFVSNYSVTLYAIAQRLLQQLDAEPSAVNNALNVLLGAMIRNVVEHRIPKALTGPLLRGDGETIKAHLSALGRTDFALKELYVSLAYQTLPIVAARGLDTKSIESVLRRAMEDADYNT